MSWLFVGPGDDVLLTLPLLARFRLTEAPLNATRFVATT